MSTEGNGATDYLAQPSADSAADPSVAEAGGIGEDSGETAERTGSAETQDAAASQSSSPRADEAATEDPEATAIRRRSLYTPAAPSASSASAAGETASAGTGSESSADSRSESAAPDAATAATAETASDSSEGSEGTTRALPVAAGAAAGGAAAAASTRGTDAGDGSQGPEGAAAAQTTALPTRAEARRAERLQGEGSADSSGAIDNPEWKSRKAARTDDDVLLDGSSIVGRPKSRAGAHWAALLVALVAYPVAWLLIHHGADAGVNAAQSLHFALSTRGLVFLGGGALVAVIGLWTARRSSLGAFTVGILSIILGAPFVAVPATAQQHVTPFLERLTTHSALGADLARYFWADAQSGKLIALGLVLVMIGVVSHSARRAGRREQEVIDRVRRAD